MAKATAVRNIRDDHQKAFLKIFNSLCGRFNRWQVWQDFVMVTAIEISNATDKQNAPERTKTYQTIISKYSDAEQNKFAELLAEVIMGMEQNPDQDFLGELYMLCELGNDASGQFFTPYDVCRCMVEISGGSDPAAENAGFFSVSDPACGAGALLIAFANLCRRKNICYHDKVLFVAQDIDLIAGLMCYIQLSFLGCAGYVVIGNTITKSARCAARRARRWTGSERSNPCSMPFVRRGNYSFRVLSDITRLQSSDERETVQTVHRHRCRSHKFDDSIMRQFLRRILGA